MIAGLDPAWIALIGTICGGSGLKLLEHWLGKSKDANDDAKNIRDELRTEMISLREDVIRLEKEVEEWRGKYYDLRDKYAELNVEYKVALAKIEKTAATAKEAVDNLSAS